MEEHELIQALQTSAEPEWLSDESPKTIEFQHTSYLETFMFLVGLVSFVGFVVMAYTHYSAKAVMAPSYLWGSLAIAIVTFFIAASSGCKYVLDFHKQHLLFQKKYISFPHERVLLHFRDVQAVISQGQLVNEKRSIDWNSYLAFVTKEGKVVRFSENSKAEQNKECQRIADLLGVEAHCASTKERLSIEKNPQNRELTIECHKLVTKDYLLVMAKQLGWILAFLLLFIYSFKLLAIFFK